MDDECLSTAEAASYLGYRGSSGVRNIVRRRELRPHGKGPRGYVFRLKDLEAFRTKRLAEHTRRALSQVDGGAPTNGGAHEGTKEGRKIEETRSEESREWLVSV